MGVHSLSRMSHTYLHRVSSRIERFIADVEIQVLDSFGHTACTLIAYFGRLFDRNSGRDDELWFLVRCKPEFRVPVIRAAKRARGVITSV